MSFTTPDFADAVQIQLSELGYTIDEGDSGWYWLFGDYADSTGYDTESEAWWAAFSDFTERYKALRTASARVVGRWEGGDLANAVNRLHMELDANLPELDIEPFIKEAAES